VANEATRLLDAAQVAALQCFVPIGQHLVIGAYFGVELSSELGELAWICRKLLGDQAGATARHREEVLRIGLNKKGRDPERASPEFLEATDEWPRTERVSLGKWLLLVAEKVTNGNIRLDRRPKGRGRIKSFAYYVKLEQRAWDRLEAAVKRSAIGATMDRAMVCLPMPWRDHAAAAI
jgi:hypothetical protein